MEEYLWVMYNESYLKKRTTLLRENYTKIALTRIQVLSI